MASHCPLEQLSTELLLKIFDHLGIQDLCNLKKTCKRFNDVINSWDHVLLRDTPLVTNQRSAFFMSRCMHRLSTLEKLRISRNWVEGRYSEKSLLFSKKKFMPWLHLNDEYIWMSRNKKIACYKRSNCSIIADQPYYILQGKGQEDIVNFQIKSNLLICGIRDGSIWLKNIIDKYTIFDLENCHKSDVNSVDLSNEGNTIVSGSRDGALKIWKLNDASDGSLKECHCDNLDDIIWKVSLSDEKLWLAVGTSGKSGKRINNFNSIIVYDIERMSDPVELCSTGFAQGILDLKWDGIHTLWSCGHEGILKRWDLRTERCEQSFPDPFGCGLYCMDYDYQNTIVTGTHLHGRAVLWDIRQKSFVQAYFMDACKGKRFTRNSPVYSLAFDAEFLFAATDQHLNILDFTGYGNFSRNYSFTKKFISH